MSVEASSSSSNIAELLGTRQIVPSILSADYARLGEQLDAVLTAGARVMHVDVMDGHFVPPITIGPTIVEAIRDQVHDAGGILDVHLMVESPERHIDPFVDAGADVVTIHQEATPHVHHALARIRETGCRAGLAINPSTPAEAVGEVVDALDLVLCMSVNPGWGGQSFIPASVDKLARLRRLLPEEVALEVDGGIKEATIPESAAAGAGLLVAGSAIFGADDPGEAFRQLAGVIEANNA